MSATAARNPLRAASVGRLENFYPSPFFDVASSYMPRTVKETFDWCMYYQQTSPIVSAVTSKLATYPITELIYTHDNIDIANRVKELFEKQFNFRMFLVETNLDRYTFGNSFSSVSFPIRKMLSCRKCDETIGAKEASYTWKGFNFHFTCKKCGHHGAARVKDTPIRSAKKIRLIRWNPKYIDIRKTEVTGEVHYYYSIPKQLKNGIALGKPDVIEEIPQQFINAVRTGKIIKLDSSKVFHSKRASISRDPGDAGWGAPLILPVLKDIFFLQVLRKSQEAVAMEHIVPMRVLFPDLRADGGNPYELVNLEDWQKEILNQITRWRRDVNHMPVMPVPVGYQAVGGHGRSLLLHQEIRIYSEQIISGLGVPVGFFYGEAMYSGASVNLRALENEFMGNRQDMLRLVEFVRDQVCTFLDIPEPGIDFKPFRMADDLQRAVFEQGLVREGLISADTFLQGRDYDYDEEQKKIRKELKISGKKQLEQTKLQAEAGGEGQIIQTKYQIQAQKLMQEAFPQQQTGPDGGPAEGGEQQPPQGEKLPAEATGGQSPMNAGIAEQAGMDGQMDAQAQSTANELAAMGKKERYVYLTRIRKMNPEFYSLVNHYLNQVKPPGSGMGNLPQLIKDPPPESGS